MPIYAESILPSRSIKLNRQTEEVNRGIRQVSDGKSVIFVDVAPAFYDANHLLDERYTYDGLHLNTDGYLLWKRWLDPIVESLAN